MMAINLQERLNRLNVLEIPFGASNPVSHRGTFGNRDFLILLLAQRGPIARRLIITQWTYWRAVKLGTRVRTVFTTKSINGWKIVTVRETLSNNRKADVCLGAHLNTSWSYRAANHFFKKGKVPGTWELSMDGWARAVRLVEALTPVGLTV